MTTSLYAQLEQAINRWKEWSSPTWTARSKDSFSQLDPVLQYCCIWIIRSNENAIDPNQAPQVARLHTQILAAQLPPTDSAVARVALRLIQEWSTS